jgi:hypothetical protein
LQSEVGLCALIPQVVAAVGGHVPVVASGGIMDGRGKHGSSPSAGGVPGGAREDLVSSLVSLGFAPVEIASGSRGEVALDLTSCP